MYCWCTSVDFLCFCVSPDSLSFIEILLHVYNFFISRVRGQIWFNLYFSADSNDKDSMNNTWNWPSYVYNSSMICILMVFLTIMGCVSFHLITTPSKSDYISVIIRIRSIKYGFMRITIQILNTVLETLQTRKRRCHSLGFQMSDCVTNNNSTHNSNVIYPVNSMSTYSIIFHFCLMKVISSSWKYG